MTVTLLNQIVTEDYNATSIGGKGGVYGYGTLIIGGLTPDDPSKTNPIFTQNIHPVSVLFHHGGYGGQSTPFEYISLQPGTYPLFSSPSDRILQLQFKNGSSNPAFTNRGVVSCWLYEPNLAGLSPQSVTPPFSNGVPLTANSIGFYNVDPPGGNPLPSGSHNFFMQLSFGGVNAGIDLMDTTTLGPGQVFPKTKGLYAFKYRILISPVGLPFQAGDFATVDMSTNNEPSPSNFWSQESTMEIDLSVGGGAGIASQVYFERYIDPAQLTSGQPNHIIINVAYVSSRQVSAGGDFSAQQLGDIAEVIATGI